MEPRSGLGWGYTVFLTPRSPLLCGDTHWRADEDSMRITFVHPPDGAIPTAPYSSIPHLTGVLKAHGHEVLACDASLETLLGMLDRKKLEAWWDTADQVRAELEAKDPLSESDQRELHRLQHLLTMPRSIFEEIEESAEVMRDREKFQDPKTFTRAFDVVRACSYFGFALSPDGYYSGRCVGHKVLSETADSGVPDPPVEVFGELIDQILEQKPDAVGITTPFDGSVFFGIKFAREIKKRAPDLPVLMGGAGVDSETYKVTSDPFYFQVLDYVMVGEGEVQLPKLLDYMEHGGDIADVKNLRWLRDDGTVGVTELELVTDLNSVAAPDFTNLPLDRYLLPDPVATFQSSRGCYYGKCTFCSELFRKGFRVRKPELVVEDMVAIYEQSGIRHFQLWDSLAPPKTLKRVAQEVKRRGLPFEWMAETKFEKPYKNEEMIRTLAEGGCTFLQFGFESASSKVLDGIDKGNNMDDVEQILALLNKYGIRAGMTWFIGFPGETEAEADLTHDYNATRRDRVMLSSYTRTFSIGTDTIVYEDQERFGIEVFDSGEGILDYKYTDGRVKWDPDERDQAYHVRGDFYMLKNNIELHYATVPKEAAHQISGQHRVGPVFRHVPEEMLPTVQLTLAPEAYYRIFDRNPLTGDRTPYGAAMHILTGFRFDLDANAIRLVQALENSAMSFPELLGKSGVPEGIARDLVDQGVNRGIFKILLDERHWQWVPDSEFVEAPQSPAVEAAG